MTLHTMWQGLETTLSAPPKSTNCLTLHLVLATKIVPLMEFIYHPLMEIHFWWVFLHAFFNERRFPLTITSNCGLQSLFKDHVNVNLNKTRIPWLHAFSKSETVLTNANFFQKRNRFDLSRVVYCEVILPSICVNLCRINFKYLNWHES